MRGFSGLFLVVCLFCAAIAFPTSDLDGDAEIVVVPLEAQLENGDGEIVTDADVAKDTVHPFFSFAPYNPFKWNFNIFDDFHNIVRQLRERVHNVWSESPVAGGADSEKSDPTVKSNSTSRVEYIDGRKVVINDTFYTKETDFGTSVYNVRVIDFLPLDDETISTADNDQSGLDVENIDDKTEVKPNNESELDKGSPEELDNNDNDNEINRDIDDVEVKSSPASPVV